MMLICVMYLHKMLIVICMVIKVTLHDNFEHELLQDSQLKYGAY